MIAGSIPAPGSGIDGSGAICVRALAQGANQGAKLAEHDGGAWQRSSTGPGSALPPKLRASYGRGAVTSRGRSTEEGKR